MTQQYIQLQTRAKEIQQFNPGGPDQEHNVRPWPSHLQISLIVGTAKESEVRPAGVQLKRKAK